MIATAIDRGRLAQRAVCPLRAFNRSDDRAPLEWRSVPYNFSEDLGDSGCVGLKVLSSSTERLGTNATGGEENSHASNVPHWIPKIEQTLACHLSIDREHEVLGWTG